MSDSPQKYPLFIQFCSETLKKPVSSFTKQDWREAAMLAGECLEALEAPPKKKPGRPRKPKIVNVLHPDYSPPKPKNREGRPNAFYYGVFSAEMIESILDRLREDHAAAVKRWADAPRSETGRLKALLTVLRQTHGGYHAHTTVKRALNRLKKSGKRDKTPK